MFLLSLLNIFSRFFTFFKTFLSNAFYVHLCNRSLRQLSFNQCGLTQLALTHIVSALRYNNTIRSVDIRPADPSPSNQPAADADNGSHGNVTSSPSTELARILRANPLLQILS